MILVKRETSKNITLTAAGTATNVRVSINHEWGDVVKTETQVATGPGTSFTYTITPEETNSAGVHRFVWKYVILGVEYTSTVYFKVYVPYITSSEFFQLNSNLDKTKFNDRFDATERAVRGIIDTYCNQDFQYINKKTLTLDGSGDRTLGTIYRLESFSKVMRDGVDEVTGELEISPTSRFYIRKMKIDTLAETAFSEPTSLHNYFSPRKTYAITGCFGWPYVPQAVADAAEILIADEFNQDSVHRKHKITFAGVGPVQTRYSTTDLLTNTTGNVDADILLMDYSRWLLEQV